MAKVPQIKKLTIAKKMMGHRAKKKTKAGSIRNAK